MILNTNNLPIGDENRKRSKMLSGMTMLELLIVVSIIAMLAALLIAGLTVSYKAMTASHTKAILANCQSVLDEIISSGTSLSVEAPNHIYYTGQKLPSGEYNWKTKKLKFNNPSYTGSNDKLKSDANNIVFVERFVWVAMQNKTSRNMLKTLGIRESADLDKKGHGNLTDSNGNGFLEVVDGWGEPILYIKPIYNDKGESDLSHDFLKNHHEPYFVSSGADGEWGDVNADPSGGDEMYKYSLDNIYSFDME